MRTEEAKALNQHEGYHQFHEEETQTAYGSFEVFFFSGDVSDLPSGPNATCWHDEYGDVWAGSGWYWWACHPGCLSDGRPSGPFASSREALQDADEWNPTFDGAQWAQRIDRASYDGQGLIVPQGKPENWAIVQADATKCERVGKLKGWGSYDGLYMTQTSESTGTGRDEFDTVTRYYLV